MPRGPPVTADPINLLLQGLTAMDTARLLPAMSRRSFTSKQVLTLPGRPMTHIYFPLTGVVSLMTTMSDGSTAEAAAVGNEGLIGMEVFLGGEAIGNVKAVQQIPGDSVVMDARSFSTETARAGRFRDVVQGYAGYLMAQAMQTGACNRLHSVEERMGRSLLLLRDRTGVDTFPLTQEFLAELLGVARPSVSIAAGVLQRAGAISYHRGRMRIADRPELEHAACECYQVLQDEYRRLMPMISRPMSGPALVSPSRAISGAAPGPGASTARDALAGRARALGTDDRSAAARRR